MYVPNVIDKYPDFREDDWTIDEIQTFCDKYGVIVKFEAKPTNEYKPNTIISQSRDPGDPIVKGANLKITYAVKYEEQKEEPKPDGEDKKTDDKKESDNN